MTTYCIYVEQLYFRARESGVLKVLFELVLLIVLDFG